jgi:hypothetical protein
MKKYLLGIFAVIVAIGLSAYSTHPATKANTLTTYWFYVSDDSPAGTTSSPTITPLPSCATNGFGCINGYESATPLDEPPVGVDPNGEFKR